MPDGRFISKTIAHSEQLAGVSLNADYLFTRCIPHLDREGRMTGNAQLVKAIAVPLREEIAAETIPALLAELADAGLIQWYEVEGKPVIQFPGFANHQKGMKKDREAPSRFPPPNGDGKSNIRPASGEGPAKVRSSSVLHPAKVGVSEVEVEVEVKSKKSTKGASPSARADKAAPWMSVIRPIYRERYDADPPSRLVKELRPAVTEHGIDEVARRYAIYCARTEGRFHDGGRFVATWGEWDGETAKIGAARAGPDPAADWYRMLVTHGLLHAGRDQFRSTVQRLVTEGVIPDEMEFIAQCRRISWPELRNQSAERFAVAYVREHVFNQRSVA